MKRKTFIILLALVSAFSFASAAKADVAVSFSVSNKNIHRRYSKQAWNRHDYRNHGHYPYGYYYWPSPLVYRTTVVKTYVPATKEKIAESGERLGIADIIVLAKAGVNDDNIIEKIIHTRSVFNLKVEEVEWLRKEGVSARVINFMLETAKKK